MAGERALLSMSIAVDGIHRRVDLLAPLQEALAAAARHVGASRPHVSCFGNYVDRGPREIIDLLLDGLPGFGRTRLGGDHEDLTAHLTRLAPHASGASHWFQSGGAGTLLSYVVGVDSHWDIEERPRRGARGHAGVHGAAPSRLPCGAGYAVCDAGRHLRARRPQTRATPPAASI